jgi:hypothetical protein
MPDINYAINATVNTNISGGYGWLASAPYNTAPTTSAIRIACSNNATLTDMAYVNAAIFR